LGQTSTFSSLWAVSKFDVTTDYDAYAFGIYDSNNAGVMAKAVPTSTSVQTIIWQTTNGVDNTVLAFGTAGLATKCLISQFTQVLTSNTAAGPYTTTTTTLGFNQANYAFYYAPSNTIALFASGGSATFSYDGGATWVASSAQYGIPGLSTSSWSGAAAGGGFALALTTNNLLIRSTI
jgi:hypothetical protein